MGSRSSVGSCSNSSKSSRSTYGRNVELPREKNDTINNIYLITDKKDDNNIGFILDTEHLYYGVKIDCRNKKIDYKRSIKYQECMDLICNHRETSRKKLDFDSGLELGEFGENLDELYTKENFISDLKERIKNRKGMKKNSSPGICKDGSDKIKSVKLVKIPYKGRNAVKAAKETVTAMTFFIPKLFESTTQDLEHWGLIFCTEYFNYVVQYGDNGIRTFRSKDFEACKDEIFEMGIDPYDKWVNDEPFRSSLDLSDIEYYTKSLIPDFNENNYNGFTNNCQFFAKALLKKIN